MWENSLLHLLVVIVEPGEGGRLGLIVKALKTELLEIWEIIVKSSSVLKLGGQANSGIVKI